MRKMKTCIFADLVIISVALYTLTGISVAEESELEIINGLILDRAITVQGHEFYKEFSQAFENPIGVAPSTLVIKELPSARWGSLIWVESDSRVLYSIQLRPGRGNIKEEAEKAAIGVTQMLFQFALNGVIENDDLDKNGY